MHLKEEDAGIASHLYPHQEYSIALHAHADDWLLKLCAHRHPFICQPSYGPELSRGHLYPWQLPEP